MSTNHKQMLRNDLRMVLQDPFGPADDVILHSKEGANHPLRGLFEAPGQDVTPSGASAPVNMFHPMLHLDQDSVFKALGRSLSNFDAVTVDGVKYRISNPKPDGFGFVDCKLQEDDDV